jgi:hypothetical protein
MELLTGKIGSKKCCPITWTDDLNAAFDTLKKALCGASCLALPQWDTTFQCVVDASATGVGGVLMQSHRPIAFLSKRLNNAERNYSTSDRELLAAVKCLKEWRIDLSYLSSNRLCSSLSISTLMLLLSKVTNVLSTLLAGMVLRKILH